jgi:hypothetical protein
VKNSAFLRWLIGKLRINMTKKINIKYGLLVILAVLVGWNVGKNMRVDNLSVATANPTSIEIGWTTKYLTKGCMIVDWKTFCENSGNKSRAHLVRVESLQPERNYKYLIRNDWSLNWRVGEFKTAQPMEEQPPLPDAAYGQVITANDELVGDALISVEAGGMKLLTKTKLDGTWAVDISSLVGDPLVVNLFVPLGNRNKQTLMFRDRHQPVPVIKL